MKFFAGNFSGNSIRGIRALSVSSINKIIVYLKRSKWFALRKCLQFMPKVLGHVGGSPVFGDLPNRGKCLIRMAF